MSQKGCYPLAPLEAILSAQKGRPVSSADMAALFGVARRNVVRWRSVGVNHKRADACAVAMGMHPYEIWPEMADHDIAAITRTCAAEDCGQPFTLNHQGAHRKYCSDRCGNRARQRRARQRAEFREAERKRNRRYYWENRRAVLIKQRARDRRNTQRAVAA